MAKPKPKYGYNPEPRLSANQLAELVNATPTRRKSIIAAAKFPSSAVVAKYKDASSSLVDFLANPARSVPTFTSAIAMLEGKASDPSLKQWARDDAARSAEALSAVIQHYNKTGLGKLSLKKLPNKQPKILLEGVEISASAACSVHGKFKGESAVGCLSLLFNKSEPSARVRDERCKTAAVLSILFSEQHLSHLGVAVPKLNMSYDVFLGKLVVAPNTFKKRLSDMSLACEEVVLRWPTIEPPEGYDGPEVS